MMRIILVTVDGTVTSMLTNNLRHVARERGVEAEVAPMRAEEVDEAQWRSADVVLVAPQVNDRLPMLFTAGAAHHVPVQAIPPHDFSTANGQHVLEQATTLVENQRFYRDAGHGYKPK